MTSDNATFYTCIGSAIKDSESEGMTMNRVQNSESRCLVVLRRFSNAEILNENLYGPTDWRGIWIPVGASVFLVCWSIDTGRLKHRAMSMPWLVGFSGGLLRWSEFGIWNIWDPRCLLVLCVWLCESVVICLRPHSAKLWILIWFVRLGLDFDVKNRECLVTASRGDFGLLTLFVGQSKLEVGVCIELNFFCRWNVRLWCLN